MKGRNINVYEGTWHTFALVTPRPPHHPPGEARYVMGKDVEALNNQRWQFAPPKDWQKWGGELHGFQHRMDFNSPRLMPVPRQASPAQEAKDAEARAANAKKISLTFVRTSSIFTNLYR
jgi:hypothetical protein